MPSFRFRRWEDKIRWATPFRALEEGLQFIRHERLTPYAFPVAYIDYPLLGIYVAPGQGEHFIQAQAGIQADGGNAPPFGVAEFQIV